MDSSSNEKSNPLYETDLPPYSMTSPASCQQEIPGFSHIEFSKYHIPDSTLSFDRTTITIHSQKLSTDPIALEAFLKEQMTLPPRPTVNITGTVQGPHRVFDLSLDLLRHICPTAEKNGSWAYTKVDGMDDSASPIKPDEKAALLSGGPDATGAGFWLRRFCADASPVKKFIFRRNVINWDTDFLAGEIRKAILATGFRGIVNVTFPVQRSVIIVQSPHQVNSLFTNLRSAFVTPRKFEVLSVVWPYAKHPRNVDEGFKGSRDCMLQSEEAWWMEWKDAVTSAVNGWRKGWISVEDKVDAAMARAPV